MKKMYLILSLCIAGNAYSQTIEAEINKLSGVFTGEWTTYKLNEKGEVVKVNAWQDTLRAGTPIINDTLAYVNINSVMHFENEFIPPYKMQFTEGFKLSDGEIEHHFFTIMGAEHIEHKINEHTYVITQPIMPFELKQLGITSAKTATNTTVKEIIDLNGKEVHLVTITSTIVWVENDEEKYTQYVSCKGYHKRME